MNGRRRTKFRKDIERGRKFEGEERSGWAHLPKEHVKFEAKTTWGSRRGRIDMKIDDEGGSVAIVEIKATDWDSIKSNRVRATAQRHARQIWRYINDHVGTQEKDVCPAIVYEFEPKRPESRSLVEEILNDRMIQVVWRK